MSAKIRNTSLKQNESLNKPETLLEEVQKKAYFIWEKEGKPQGKIGIFGLEQKKRFLAI